MSLIPSNMMPAPIHQSPGNSSWKQNRPNTAVQMKFIAALLIVAVNVFNWFRLFTKQFNIIAFVNNIPIKHSIRNPYTIGSSTVVDNRSVSTELSEEDNFPNTPATDVKTPAPKLPRYYVIFAISLLFSSPEFHSSNFNRFWILANQKLINFNQSNLRCWNGAGKIKFSWAS